MHTLKIALGFSAQGAALITIAVIAIKNRKHIFNQLFN